MKTVARILAALVLLAMLYWSGTYLYWHIHITRAIRTLEMLPLGGNPPDDELKLKSAYDTLTAAGTRSLPYLIDVFETTSRPRNIAMAFLHIIRLSALDRNRQEEDAFLNSCIYPESVDMEVRRERADKLRAWWQREGHFHRPIWRIWSSNCRPVR
jgi:hypothetical protein